MAWLREVDARVKVAGVLILGIGLWHTKPLGVLLCALLVGFLVLPFLTSKHVRRMELFFFLFSFFWALLKGGFGLWDGMLFVEAGELAAFYGGRLFVLLNLGLFLSESSSARQIARALYWFVRPFIGTKRGWQISLSLAMMIHFIPLVGRVMQKTGQTLRLRFPDFGFWRKLRILPGMVMRIMAGKTFESALGASARGLDRAEAWDQQFVLTGRDVLVLLLFCSGGLCLFVL